jgi:hypothetical protein
MKILHLTLKKKWFDMIASGEKKEEYREIKPYWVSRLVDGIEAPREWEINEGFTFYIHGHLCVMETAMHYDLVEFKNGYSKKAPTIRLEVLDILQDYGKEKWGAEYGKPYFVIKLGNIIPFLLNSEQEDKRSFASEAP